MSLKCSIGSVYLKCWGRMIHTLAQSGENDVHFEFTSDSLTLTTFDSSLSICCSCKFDKTFFEKYDVKAGNHLSCKVPIKCLLKPFKSLRFLLKCSDACEFEFDPERNIMVVSFPCKGGIRLRYTLSFAVQDEFLQVECNSDELKSMISGDPKLILKSLSNFTGNKGVADLTISVNGDTILLKNCVNDMIKKEGKVYTELTMNAVDFIDYKIATDTELTFPMREFKSFVTFAEHLKASLCIRFLGSEEPVYVKASNDSGLYTATLFMATKSSSTEEPSKKKKRKDRPNESNVSSHNVSSCHEIYSGETRLGSSPNQSLSSQSRQNHPNDNQPANNIVPVDLENEPEVMVIPEDDNPNTSTYHNTPEGDNNNSSAISTTEDGSKRIKMLFSNLGRPFDPTVDVPGYNDILVACSDDEDD